MWCVVGIGWGISEGRREIWGGWLGWGETVGVAGADRQRGGGGREIGVAVRWGVAIAARAGEAKVGFEAPERGCVSVGDGGVECALLQRREESSQTASGWSGVEPVGET